MPEQVAYGITTPVTKQAVSSGSEFPSFRPGQVRSTSCLNWASDGISGKGSTRPASTFTSSSSSDSDSDGLDSKERQRLRTGLNLSLSLSHLSRILPPSTPWTELLACLPAVPRRSTAAPSRGRRDRLQQALLASELLGGIFGGEKKKKKRSMLGRHQGQLTRRERGLEKGVARPSTAGEHLTRRPMSLQGEEEEEGGRPKDTIPNSR
uniref:Uncharacterized protein n=1 Tax=Coccidioides posadasii RMSCC 3488 TaxID=454284 RepID=A0A0J6FF07_COCPO|nr:hypothetical protein CPAG_08047 [Coccidioides posadasii RMSCC 3488]